MKGKILNFKAEKGFGFILGEDNQNYFFHISTVSNPMDIAEGYSVDFKTKEGKKGLNAVNITVQTPLSGGRSKDKILKIDNLRIRASDIKEYIILESLEDGRFVDKDGNYHYDLPEKIDGYEYKGSLTNRIDRCENISVDIYHNISTSDKNMSSKEIRDMQYTQYKRYCYTLEIDTYTNGIKSLEFKSHDGSKNKKEVYKWLDYIDEEMDKLI